MTSNPEPTTPSVPEIQARLNGIARLVRNSRTIDPESKQPLLELVNDLGKVLQTGEASPAEVAPLAETTGQLADALHHQHEGIRDRIERALLAAEAAHPVTVAPIH